MQLDNSAELVSRSCRRQYGLLLGSGTTALFLACNIVPQDRHKVVVPAITCTSVLFAVLHAGCEPVFVDVLPESGLIDPQSFRKAVDRDPLIGAVVIVHTFGNVADFKSIAAIAQLNNILIIEDAAQAQGATYPDGMPVGALGDLSLVSFGKTKILDLNGGAVLMTDSSEIHSRCIYLSQKLPPRPSNIDNLFTSFRSLYYENWHARKIDPLALFRIGKMYIQFRQAFFHRANEVVANRIISALPKLNAEKMERLKLAAEYTHRLSGLSEIKFINLAGGSVPWRYVILVPENDRDILIEDLRKSNLDASSWYPSLTNFYSKDADHISLPQATAFENQVLNFWVNPGYGINHIRDVCSLIRKYFSA